LAIPTSQVSDIQVAQTAPLPQGGLLLPGTFVLTARTLYTGPGGQSGPSGPTREGTIIIGGNQAQYTLQYVEQKMDPMSGTTVDRTAGPSPSPSPVPA
jgi:hypothetical protein